MDDNRPNTIDTGYVMLIAMNHRANRRRRRVFWIKTVLLLIAWAVIAWVLLHEFLAAIHIGLG